MSECYLHICYKHYGVGIALKLCDTGALIHCQGMVSKARGKYFNSKGKIFLLMSLGEYLQNTSSQEDWALWPRGRQALTVWPLSGSTTSKKGFHYMGWEVLLNLRESATVTRYFTGSVVGNMKGMNKVWKTHAWQSHKGHLRKWCPPSSQCPQTWLLGVLVDMD